MLDVSHVTKKYGKVTACNDVSLHLDPGSVTVLLGPNGAGKSTLMKSIIGFLRYDGEITVGGFPNKTTAARRLLGYIPEMPSLYPNLTASEHMEFVARAYRLTDYKQRADELFDRFELNDKRKKFGDELSKGMQQKLNICLGLLPEPKMLLLDEPMIGLDPHAIKQLKSIIEQMRNEGKTLLVSTHIIDSVDMLEVGAELTLEDTDAKQHFTQPPAHYTEAALVKTLEELGIGRPSTYAPTITTIIGRRYIAKENKNLYVTEIGEVVNNMMKEAFPSIVDLGFTANVELLLDKIAEGSVPYKTVIRNFYPDLAEAVEMAEKNLEKVKIEDEVTDVICEECGRNMVVKYGPHGKFLACPGFPECRNTKPYLEKIGVACPLCGKEVVIRKTKKGRKYFGCENNPECEFMSWQRPSTTKCPKCGGYMLWKGNKLVCADEQCGTVIVNPQETEEVTVQTQA